MFIGLIKTIIFILFIYYAFKFSIRLFGPFLMKKAIDKMKKKAEGSFGGTQQQPDVREGETIIDKKPQNSKKSNDSIGDYVDFEEID